MLFKPVTLQTDGIVLLRTMSRVLPLEGAIIANSLVSAEKWHDMVATLLNQVVFCVPAIFR